MRRRSTGGSSRACGTLCSLCEPAWPKFCIPLCLYFEFTHEQATTFRRAEWFVEKAHDRRPRGDGGDQAGTHQRGDTVQKPGQEPDGVRGGHASPPGNFSGVSALHRVSMSPQIRRRHALLLLAVYLPVMGLIGVLHTDEMSGGGAGRLSTDNAAGSVERGSPDDGSCLACLFATGHAPLPETILPSIAFESEVVELAVAVLSGAAIRTIPGRSPPHAPLS